MAHQKCTRSVGVKMPDVLYDDIARQVMLLNAATRRREPHARGTKIAHWIKDACTFRMTLIKGLRIGYYALREIPDPPQEETGLPEGNP